MINWSNCRDKFIGGFIIIIMHIALYIVDIWGKKYKVKNEKLYIYKIEHISLRNICENDLSNLTNVK